MFSVQPQEDAEEELFPVTGNMAFSFGGATGSTAASMDPLFSYRSILNIMIKCVIQTLLRLLYFDADKLVI